MRYHILEDKGSCTKLAKYVKKVIKLEDFKKTCQNTNYTQVEQSRQVLMLKGKGVKK